jgi:hypothetical protein
MVKTLRLTELSKLSPTERDAAVRDLARSALAQQNGETEAVGAQIRAFERRYEMTSAAMEAKLASGALQETAEIASWLIALDAQRRMRGRET